MPIPVPIAIGGAAGLGAAFVGWQSVWPGGRMWGRIYRHGDRTRRHYAITFDDGPTAGATERVLDVLGEAGVKATFFVIGRNVERWPDLVARMDREGHLVGNHSYDHWRYGACRHRRYWEAQVRRTDDAIIAVIGKRPAMFRPPLGVKTLYINGAATRTGHAVITWTQRARDGVRVITPETILSRIVPHTVGGDVLLLHDGAEPGRSRDASATVACIAPLVRQLRDKGLEPAPLDELLKLPAYQPAVTSFAAQ
jgi:peptidoglycan/xylan/chitin deacetylase (PgdA/CDA1 family)